jgi:hypothetical protein
MRFRFEYASTRREVWHWYWRMWRAHLWKAHALVAVVACFCVVARLGRGGPDIERDLLWIVGTAIAFVAGWILYPQIAFKAEMRVLEVDDQGIATTIGKRSRVRSWAQIRSVIETKDHVIVQSRTGNAFLIPKLRPLRAVRTDA